MKRPRNKFNAGSCRLRIDCLERRQLLAAMRVAPVFEAEAIHVEVAPADTLLNEDVIHRMPSLVETIPLAAEFNAVDLGVLLGEMAGSPTGVVAIPNRGVGSQPVGPIVLDASPSVSRPMDILFSSAATPGGTGIDPQLAGRPGQPSDDVMDLTPRGSSRPGPQLPAEFPSGLVTRTTVADGAPTGPVSLDTGAASTGFGLATNRWTSDPAVVGQGNSASRDGNVPNEADTITEVGIDFAELLAVATQNTPFKGEEWDRWHASDDSLGVAFTAGTLSDVNALPMAVPPSQGIASDTSQGRYRYVEVASEPLRPGAQVPNRPSAQLDIPHRTVAMSQTRSSPLEVDGESQAPHGASHLVRHPFAPAPPRVLPADATGPSDLTHPEIEPKSGWWAYVQKLARRLTGVADVLVASSATAGFVLLNRGLDPDEYQPPAGRQLRRK